MSVSQFTIILAKAIWPLLLIGAIGLLLIIKDIVEAIVHGYKSYATRTQRKPAQVAQESAIGDNRAGERPIITDSLYSAEN